MKNYFLIYDDCCFYEITLLGYFMKYSSFGEQPCAYCMAAEHDTGSSGHIRTAEGFCVKADVYLKDIAPDDVRSFIIPGGDITKTTGEELKSCLLNLDLSKTCIGAICAGVDILDIYGLLEGRQSIRTSDAPAVNDGMLITARPNGYVDFAVETGRTIGLFTDEEDVRETLDFFKYHKSVE